MNPQQVVSEPRFRRFKDLSETDQDRFGRRIEEGSEELKFRSHHCCKSEESVDVARFAMSKSKEST